MTATGRARDLKFKTFSVHTCGMAISKEEHAKYLQDVQAFLTEVGAYLDGIQLNKSAGMRFVYEGGGKSGAKKEAFGYGDGDGFLGDGEELGDYEKGFVWYTGGTVIVKISGPRDKETEGMDIGLINEIPDDIKVRLEPEDEQYTLDDIDIQAAVIDGKYDMHISGRKIEFSGLSSHRMTAEEVDFFVKTFIPAAEKYGIDMDENFVLRMEYYSKNREEIEHGWAVDDFLEKINARKASVEGGTRVLVHARADRFELALDGKDIVWFDVNENVNDFEYDFITRRVDEVAKELGFTFHDGPEPDATEGPTPQPEQPRPMPSVPPEITKRIESLPLPPPRMALVDMSEVEAMIPDLPPPMPLPPAPTYAPKHVESQSEPQELLPSWVLEVQSEQLNASQESPAPAKPVRPVKKVLKVVKKKQTDLSGKEDEWPGDR
jgi:hypothetical protein